MVTIVEYITDTLQEVMVYLYEGTHLKWLVTELTKFSACIMTRVFCEPSRGV